jgi:adenylate kinase
MPQISTGDLLRAAVSAGTSLGKEAKSFMDKGELVPDRVVLGMVEERLKQDDCKKVIFSMVFRGIQQTEELDKMSSQHVLRALSIDVPSNLRRAYRRRTQKACGQMYNIYFNASKKEGACDKCGGALFQRDDDKEETIKKRLEVYNAQTAPLMDYYGKKGIVKAVQGTGSIDDIFNKVCEVLGLK